MVAARGGSCSTERGTGRLHAHDRDQAHRVAPNRIVSVTTYNGQFPGPLLRLKEGERVTVDIHNDTDTPEQLHWHGQFVSPDVDGAAEEGTPSFRPTAAGEFLSCRGHRDCASITPTSAPERIWRRPVQRTGGTGLHRTEAASRQLRSRSVSHAERVSAHVEPRRRHGDGLPLARQTVPALKDSRREQDESVARQGHAARLRSGLRFLHHQWAACWAMASRCA